MATLLVSCLAGQSHSAPPEARLPSSSELPCQQTAQDTVLRLQARSSFPTPSTRIAIIIDDLGYNRRFGHVVTDLPGQVTLAILPHSPHGPRLAEQAARAGKEVIVHLPMSSINGGALDNGGLTDTMDRELFLSVLRGNLKAIPQARGANNHMGSLLTQQREAMQWLMEELGSRGLYFVDSRTTALTVAAQTAREQNLPVLERKIFLDNKRECAAISEQFLQLARLSRRDGHGLAIGHPHPQTLGFLSALLPHLESGGLTLVPASRLLESEATAAPELGSKRYERDRLNNRRMK